jgi:hypothetical protein
MVPTGIKIGTILTQISNNNQLFIF